MKRIIIVIIYLLLTRVLFSQTVPYNQLPDWTSTASGHIATGLGLADINGDGWKDLVAGNGNDISRQHLVVYYNDGTGHYPLLPDWQSDDIDYHGHLACGDIDQDGDIDVAISVYIGETGFNSPGKVKVYYNQGNELEGSPSFVSNPFYTFSCTLGDADGDGDLDLATVAGEPYHDILDHGKIFINDGGTFQPDAQWLSDNTMGALDVEFGDINRDGFMDIIFVCENTDNYIYLGYNGGISTSPAWHSEEVQSYINSMDIGYIGDDVCNIVMTENSQLGGQGRVRSYVFNGPLPDSSQADWVSDPFGYGSGIILADVDLDNVLDLVYGGWWLPVNVALGTANGYQLSPAYTSSTSSVVEAIQMADLGKESIMAKSDTITIPGSMQDAHILILPDQLVENITSLEKNETLLVNTDFTYVPNKPWLSVAGGFQEGDTFVVYYEHSPHPDMVITNWDNNKGNYIFYNTNPPVGIPEAPGQHDQLSIFPNPASGMVTLQLNSSAKNKLALTVSDLSGRIISKENVYMHEGIARKDVSALAPGAYIVKLGVSSRILIKKDD